MKMTPRRIASHALNLGGEKHLHVNVGGRCSIAQVPAVVFAAGKLLVTRAIYVPRLACRPRWWAPQHAPSPLCIAPVAQYTTSRAAPRALLALRVLS
jgi:hypothetical protein